MSDTGNRELERQRSMLEQEAVIQLIAPCGVNDGILRVDETSLNNLLNMFSFEEGNISFFIPSSGSGSRMFAFLFEYQQSQIPTKEVQHFFSCIKEFPFYNELRKELGEEVNTENWLEVCEILLGEDKFNFGCIPKGLVPFHSENGRIYNAFQEHVRQACELAGDNARIHFTIQPEFEDEIRNATSKVAIEKKAQITFSFQDTGTDAFCFDEHNEPLIEDNSYLRRPAGHGALLKNLEDQNSSFLLVKNIDNVQHHSKAGKSYLWWKVLFALVKEFQRDLKVLNNQFSQQDLELFNQKYKLFRKEELDQVNKNFIADMMRRPTRACGMVFNHGEPGGGPFWVKSGAVSTKQIVEKSQIPNEPEFGKMIEQSTHFNPVFMVLDKNDVTGKPCDLNKFSDPDAFIRVVKDHKGKKVVYHELPGLWNGSMSQWNALFVEVPMDVFSPVKTVLDLLKDAHQA